MCVQHLGASASVFSFSKWKLRISGALLQRRGSTEGVGLL